LWVARGLPAYRVRDGIVLGAAVGFGFAALESSGYALSALFVRQGGAFHLSLSSLVETELLRGLLAPVGHGLWTALLGGVRFGAGRGGRLRLTRAVLLAYLFVSLLHGLWDSMDGLAAALTWLLAATPDQRAATALGETPAPTAGQVMLFNVLYLGGL